MKKAIIYGRVSTNKQSAESIETQIAECKKWAVANDCEIVDIYDDSGQSGRSYNVGNRDGFNQILEDAKNGRMEYAIIHKIDRFARSVLDYFMQEKELLKYGVKIIVSSMPFLNDAGIVVKTLYIAMAEQFSINLSDEVSTKMLTFAKKGAYLGAQAPYGYDLKIIDGVKQYVINPEQAEGVKLIYKTYLAGNGYIRTSQIAAKAGYVNGKGFPFNQQSIRTMLQNKRYNGYYVFGLRTMKDGKRIWNTDPESIVEIPNSHPKIIDDETFQAVQNKIASRVTKNKTKKRVYPLTGKMTCGICGRPFTGYGNTKKINPNNIDYNLYRCTGPRWGLCEATSVRAIKIENYIFDRIKSYVFNDRFVADLLSSVENSLKLDVSSLQKLKTQIEKDLKKVNTEIKAAMREQLSKRKEAELYEEMIEEMSDEKAQLEKRLENISQQIAVDDKSSSIKNYISKIKKGFSSPDDEIKNAILMQVVREVIIYKDKIDVYLNMSDNPPPPKRGGKTVGLDLDKIGDPLLTISCGLYNCNTGVPVDKLNIPLNVFSFNGIDMLNFNKNRSEIKKAY